MNAERFSVDDLFKMAHSPVHNYILPGMTSYLIGNPSDKGTVRLFKNSREQQESVVPHSHRFDFQCWVLRGSVRNRVWMKCYSGGDIYESTILEYNGEMGNYTMKPGLVNYWKFNDETYEAGQCYHMVHHEIHSIFFSRDALVLFFEGPKVASTSIALQPVVNGITIPTLEVKPWMFQKGETV